MMRQVQGVAQPGLRSRAAARVLGKEAIPTSMRSLEVAEVWPPGPEAAWPLPPVQARLAQGWREA